MHKIKSVPVPKFFEVPSDQLTMRQCAERVECVQGKYGVIQVACRAAPAKPAVRVHLRHQEIDDSARRRAKEFRRKACCIQHPASYGV